MVLRPPPDVSAYRLELSAIIEEILLAHSLDEKSLRRIVKKHPKNKTDLFAKDELLQAYRLWHESNDWPLRVEDFSALVAKKPIRTASGVVPVTVLTMPHPCPGQCIFCPNDVRMPKSYVSSEPGCRRAEENRFDPYWQVRSRLLAYARYGHNPQKVELIILGGTWASYPKGYRQWFIERCFDAMNAFSRDDQPILPNLTPLPEASPGARRGQYNQLVQLHASSSRDDWSTSTEATLDAAQQTNESATIRCVGLSVETRPESVSLDELLFARQLGITKFQIGVQSTNEDVLEMNQRGHSLEETKRAFTLLRRMGFKIQAHWMLNLYGVEFHEEVPLFQNLFTDLQLKPDELKVYPCVLLEDTVLWEHYQKGLWKPYTSQELVDVIADMMTIVPAYTRVSRVIRDFPSDEIVAGNQKGNLREDIDAKNRDLNQPVQEIRSREVRLKKTHASDIRFSTLEYETGTSTEIFFSAVNGHDDLLGFLRLSLPFEPALIPELEASAMIREVHVYGRSQNWERDNQEQAQHQGLGEALIRRAMEASVRHGFRQLAVISSVGTRGYYRRFGFMDGPYYQCRDLSDLQFTAA